MSKKSGNLVEFSQGMQRARSSYVLRLYVAGATPRSQRAVTRVTQICDEILAGKCELTVVDIFQQPALAKADQIVAVPALIRKLPLPTRQFVGDMADTAVVIEGLTL